MTGTDGESTENRLEHNSRSELYYKDPFRLSDFKASVLRYLDLEAQADGDDSADHDQDTDGASYSDVPTFFLLILITFNR